MINGGMSHVTSGSSTRCERSEQCPHPPNVVPQDVSDSLVHESKRCRNFAADMEPKTADTCSFGLKFRF